MFACLNLCVHFCVCACVCVCVAVDHTNTQTCSVCCMSCDFFLLSLRVQKKFYLPVLTKLGISRKGKKLLHLQHKRTRTRPYHKKNWHLPLQQKRLSLVYGKNYLSSQHKHYLHCGAQRSHHFLPTLGTPGLQRLCSHFDFTPLYGPKTAGVMKPCIFPRFVGTEAVGMMCHFDFSPLLMCQRGWKALYLLCVVFRQPPLFECQRGEMYQPHIGLLG